MDIDWNLSRVFLAALDEASLSGAARVLDVAQPTVSRQLASLEQQLGVTLFTRSPRGLQATPDAMQLEPHARAMAAAAARLSRAATADRMLARGVIRISASEVIGAEVLPPLLASLYRAHPELTVELSLSNQVEDVLGGDIDLAVRMVRPTQESLVARRLGVVELGLFAHRDYLAGRSAPGQVGELDGHVLIGFDHDSPFLRRIMHDLPLQPGSFALRCDSDLAQLAAVRSGVGIGFVQRPLAAKQADLVPILPGKVGFELPLWLTMHEDQRRTPRVRVLFDHLADGLTKYLSGQ